MADLECVPLHTFHLMGKKNFVPILEEFYYNRFTGFNAMTRKIGITPKQLSERLNEMEEQLLLMKENESYHLTPKGKELGELVQHLKGFHARYHEGLSACARKPCSDCITFVKNK